MPRATFYQPVEEILNGKCNLEYMDSNGIIINNDSKSRICHVTLPNTNSYNQDVLLMIFTIRNQGGIWKIHSEGPKRTDPGSTVPLRNTAVRIAKENNWKYIALAVSSLDVDPNDIITKYFISIESFEYGEATVYDLSNELKQLKNANEPNFYRFQISLSGKNYSLAFIKKTYFLEYLYMFDNRPYLIEENRNLNSAVPKFTGAKNILLYGVPGAGKSHKIKTEFCNDENFMERTVFHPDYTYSDFVGQIMPKNENGNISYPFVPGPFTRILKAAYNDTTGNPYYLIVEEINRGNAPAIFGEIFQLLDRNASGESEYGISNPDIANEVFGDEKRLVKLPSNLFVLATMNTADQNVFTLDTAFKRRWIMECIENDIDNSNRALINICGRNTNWKTFAHKINDKIIECGEGNLSSEDNRLGAYFVSIEELKDPKLFAEKVLMYLWNDAFKYDRNKIFKPAYKTLEDLIKGFKREAFEVFTDELDFDNSIVSLDEQSTTLEEITPEQYLTGTDSLYVGLFETLRKELINQDLYHNEYAVKNYIAIRENKRNYAEFHVLKNEIKILTKVPKEEELLIGEDKPNTGWSLSYETRLSTETDIPFIVRIIKESLEQIKG